MVLFDGDCAVCHAGVNFLLDHDVEGRLRYAALQGPYAAEVRARTPDWPEGLDSLVLVEPGRTSWYSTGVLRMASYLPAPWRWATVLLWVPRPLRDAAYRAFAAVRYRVFGRVERCRVPRAAEVGRFLA